MQLDWEATTEFLCPIFLANLAHPCQLECLKVDVHLTQKAREKRPCSNYHWVDTIILAYSILERIQ